ncbi:antitoxin of toxin-antitoxin stability system [Arvimicrobium flavum]|uniref:antitoxin of toxin-antitoxin stability system n=1 Tax=Arvimicrobium flavum TaxID=3393320 RepID=UPI00237B344C|nr:antitoxin of toxin-antitoxin stability system [Mesorhizobium shangrilense]
MAKEAVFTMKLEPELREAFMAAAAAADRPASQIVREFMRDYVEESIRRLDYDDYYRRKIERARRSIDAGIGRSDEEVRTEFAARVAALRGASRKTA